MGLSLPAFADAEEVAYTLLSPLDAPVVKATGPEIIPPLILIRRIGGTCDYVTDFAEIMVVAIGDTRQDSVALQLRCQARIENSFNTTVTLPDQSVVQIDGTSTVLAGHPQEYENIDIREAAAVYQLRMRRPLIPAP
jgi:hypothetical protein